MTQGLTSVCGAHRTLIVSFLRRDRQAHKPLSLFNRFHLIAFSKKDFQSRTVLRCSSARFAVAHTDL